MEPNTIKTLRSVTVTLSVDEITKIVKSYLEAEGFEVQTVEFKISTETRGYGPGEYEVKSFDGCDANCRLITERRNKNEAD